MLSESVPVSSPSPSRNPTRPSLYNLLFRQIHQGRGLQVLVGRAFACDRWRLFVFFPFFFWFLSRLAFLQSGSRSLLDHTHPLQLLALHWRAAHPILPPLLFFPGPCRRHGCACRYECGRGGWLEVDKFPLQQKLGPPLGRADISAAGWDRKGQNCTYLTPARPKQNLHWNR